VAKQRRRQAERSRTTRAAVIEAARVLFVEQGYANVSSDQIVAAAGVTRGALYHHFGGKRELFRTVFEETERSLTEEIASAVDALGDPAAGMAVGLTTFLDICQRPDVMRLVLTDAPAVLGWQEWRAIEARHGLGLIRRNLERAARDRLLVPAPLEVLAHLVLSAMIEAALLVAHAPDPGAARAEAERGLAILLSGLVIRPADAPGR
jgi:AcrR family transcriptional regulator